MTRIEQVLKAIEPFFERYTDQGFPMYSIIDRFCPIGTRRDGENCELNICCEDCWNTEVGEDQHRGANLLINPNYKKRLISMLEIPYDALKNIFDESMKNYSRLTPKEHQYIETIGAILAAIDTLRLYDEDILIKRGMRSE